MKLDEFRRIQKSGIYCLRNEQEKKVQIFSTKCILEHLNYTLKNGEYSITDDTIFEVLEDDLSDLELKVMWGYWLDFFKQQDYTFYKNVKYPKYTVKEGVQIFDNRLVSCVYLENTRRDKIVIGLFDSVKESKQFLNDNYPNGDIPLLYFADNDLTIQYRNSIQK